ncbi:hypothetical protein B4U79_00817 [Dinothrombium tinctorium]|uniref:Protein sleepless n=1 Tax=Dinothrombium tinctorium TaxID=1965070 RepID=A0A443RPT0_9ACAR|nr:hypothetical protein B4U79_00817 [Dinothrombium tinctorium]
MKLFLVLTIISLIAISAESQETKKSVGSYCTSSDECSSDCCVMNYTSRERTCQPLATNGQPCSIGQVKGGYYADYCPCEKGLLEDHVRVIRDCGWIDEDKDKTDEGECVKRSGTFSVLVQYCTCYSDKLLALECWDCGSRTRPCQDPFEETTDGAIDCSSDNRTIKYGEAKFCRKIVQKFNDQERIYRGCGWLEDDSTTSAKLTPGECVKKAGTYQVMVQYCTCTGNKCNSEFGLSPQPILLFICLLSFLSLFRI